MLDFFVFCDRVLPFLTKMVMKIRDIFWPIMKKSERGERHPILTIIHNLWILTWRLKAWNQKEQKCLILRIMMTKSNSNNWHQIPQGFFQCFENNLNLLEQIANWPNVLKSYCSKAFKKIRINKTKMLSLLTNRSLHWSVKEISYLEMEILSVKTK